MKRLPPACECTDDFFIRRWMQWNFAGAKCLKIPTQNFFFFVISNPNDQCALDFDSNLNGFSKRFLSNGYRYSEKKGSIIFVEITLVFLVLPLPIKNSTLIVRKSYREEVFHIFFYLVYFGYIYGYSIMIMHQISFYLQPAGVNVKRDSVTKRTNNDMKGSSSSKDQKIFWDLSTFLLSIWKQLLNSYHLFRLSC